MVVKGRERVLAGGAARAGRMEASLVQLRLMHSLEGVNGVEGAMPRVVKWGEENQAARASTSAATTSARRESGMVGGSGSLSPS